MLTTWILVVYLSAYSQTIIIENNTTEMNCQLTGDDIVRKSKGDARYYTCSPKNPILVEK